MIKHTKAHFLIYIVSSFAALAGLLFGYDTGVISGAILFIRQDFALSPALTEITVSAVLLGALIGSGLSGRVIDVLGRRKVLIATALIFIVGSLSSALAGHISMLIIGRIILGIAIGIGSFTAPLYLAELAPYQIRGMLVSLNQLAITVGIVLSYVVDYSLANIGGWRWMLALGVLPAAILLVGSLFLPESPRWMILRGRNQQARSVLESIRNTTDVGAELNEIEQSIKTETSSWRVLTQKWLRPIIWISLGLSLFQQATGINTIIYYAPTVLEMAGFHEATGAILATLGVGIINVLFTIIALPLIDRWGRRPLLLLGLTGMFISLAIMGAAFHYPNLAALKSIAVGSMLLYIACFAMSLGPIMWLIISEIFPLAIRGTGVSLAVSASWGFNMIVALTFLTLIQVLGASGTFWLYALLCILGWLFVYWIVPETKGCSLEEIERNLRLRKPARQLGAASSPVHTLSTPDKQLV